jgi:hypothetical protein
LKTGQSKWFIGYKKHSLRLWFSVHEKSVVLIPLISWTAPANRSDVNFLQPSLRYIYRHLEFAPWIVLADMAYINMETQRRLREQLGVGVLTKLPPNYELPEKVRAALLQRCHQGQPLRWLGLRQDEQLHWYGVDSRREWLCPYCWEASRCPREFSFRPDDHEIALGTVPLNSATGQRLLRQSRSWIEATQSYEKLQLGLSGMFLNSLRLTSIVCLLADMVLLLRVHALTSQPQSRTPLGHLLPSQLSLDF